MEIIDFNSQINKNAKRAIIFVHGWKGNKDSFMSLPNMLNLESTSWYFPEAPYIIDNDDKTRSWSYQKEDGSFEEFLTFAPALIYSSSLIDELSPESFSMIT